MAEGQAAHEGQFVAAIAQAVALGTAAAHGSEDAKRAIQAGLSGGGKAPAGGYTDEEILALASFLGKSPAHVRKLIAEGKRPPRVRVETTYA